MVACAAPIALSVAANAGGRPLRRDADAQPHAGRPVPAPAAVIRRRDRPRADGEVRRVEGGHFTGCRGAACAPVAQVRRIDTFACPGGINALRAARCRRPVSGARRRWCGDARMRVRRAEASRS